MRFRKFGELSWEVSEIGLGTWALGSNWGPQDESESLRTLHAALDSGCNLIDTARAYGDGRSERLIAQALKQRPRADHVYVATKVPPLANGKLRAVGVSTPEIDQNAVIDLMRRRCVDSIQVIYNLFDQEAQAEIFSTALEHGVAVIVRVALDESSLTGNLTGQSSFPQGDIRSSYFAGDRLQRTVDRVEKIRAVVGAEEPSLAAAALKFAIKPPVVSTVIVGTRTAQQAKVNYAVGCEPQMSDDLEHKLRGHNWQRSFWYAGK